MTAQRPQLGWIGYGQFGRFAVPHLTGHFDVQIYDPALAANELAGVDAVQVDLDGAAACPFVVLAVPVQGLRALLADLTPRLSTGALVLDVASVKSLPLRWMADALPDTVDFAGLHPMFGPQSGRAGLTGLHVVVCPGRGERGDCVRKFLESLGLSVIETDADRHDREAAYSQALAQYVGRALASLEGEDFQISTPAAAGLRHVSATVADDSWELFEAIQNLNPYAASMRAEVRRRLAELEERLDASGDRPGPSL